MTAMFSPRAIRCSLHPYPVDAGEEEGGQADDAVTSEAVGLCCSMGMCPLKLHVETEATRRSKIGHMSLKLFKAC